MPTPIGKIRGGHRRRLAVHYITFIKISNRPLIKKSHKMEEQLTSPECKKCSSAFSVCEDCQCCHLCKDHHCYACSPEPFVSRCDFCDRCQECDKINICPECFCCPDCKGHGLLMDHCFNCQMLAPPPFLCLAKKDAPPTPQKPVLKKTRRFLLEDNHCNRCTLCETGDFDERVLCQSRAHQKCKGTCGKCKTCDHNLCLCLECKVCIECQLDGSAMDVLCDRCRVDVSRPPSAFNVMSVNPLLL